MSIIKNALIKMMENLEGIEKLPADQRADFKKAIHLLKKKDPQSPSQEYAPIPDNEAGKEEAIEFIRYLFSEVNPELVNGANESHYDECMNTISHVKTYSKKKT